ncbi:MAG: hypothetical protein IIC61_04135 [Proteobacteria bacterium]|nr:hypothetical protein [Pseudomonadota bacterium]
MTRPYSVAHVFGIKFHASPDQDKDGTMVGVSYVVQDITKRIQLAL